MSVTDPQHVAADVGAGSGGDRGDRWRHRALLGTRLDGRDQAAQGYRRKINHDRWFALAGVFRLHPTQQLTQYTLFSNHGSYFIC